MPISWTPISWELLYGRKKSGKHRIIFKIDADAVYILYIRHTARDELEP